MFTPGRLPLGRHNVYVPRYQPEKRLRSVLDRRNVPVVYGEYGVGKTSLVRKYFDVRPASPCIYLTADNLTLERLFQIVLERLEVFLEQRRTRTAKQTGGGEVSAVVMKATGDLSHETSHEWTSPVGVPTTQRMIDLMVKRKLTLVLDEMHKASVEFRTELAHFIKTVNGYASDYPQVVIVGTTTDAVALVDRDPGIDRIVKEVRVRPLNRDESRYIVRTGFRRLRLDIPESLVNNVISIAAGAPTIVHALCLGMAEKAWDRDSNHVSLDVYRESVEEYVQEEHHKRLIERYMKAIETTGKKRYRRCIIRAVAELESDYATLEDIRRAVAHYIGEDVTAHALSGPLRDLKSEKYGRLLVDVRRSSDGTRVYNLSRFADPTMKYFVRFLVELDYQQLALPLHLA